MDSFLNNSAVKALLPVPKDVGGEAKRAAKYLAKVAQVGEWTGVATKVSEKIQIPPSIISNAKGLAVFKVLKGGFIWSGRIGSGLCVARLPDGSWSAPAVFGMFGVGVGGQIGAQQTYLVLVLNTEAGISAFSSPGNVTLGADIGVSAGPIGREGSVSGAVVGFAPIYSYSKTQGLYAGVSLEGTVIFERRDANSKFYGHKVTAAEILKGKVQQPLEAKPLYNAIAAIMRGDLSEIMGLDGRQPGARGGDDSDDEPASPVRAPGGYLDSGAGSAPSTLGRSPASLNRSATTTAATRVSPPAYSTVSSTTTRDEDRDRKTPAYTSIAAAAAARGGGGLSAGGASVQRSQSDRKPPPPPPPRKPDNLRSKDMVTAVYPFEGLQPGDLDLVPGETYEVIERTATADGWWKGRNPRNGKEGVFPGNYVKDNK
ncbi:DUF500-domain-containing protein [Gonapodya prolifera JEL478]|uniref:DUF500-domain-containing protein n=1 Tax=Gonapodya prolifera (strain JEL478) TaxID=1344416 RepID=A0A139ANA9_GONPJ|nr:DUF500-domain-containing protein [Gonapodya prolifera JEL478]|eukprot:KXS18229.1 DUF500-domain-containing protein [Gonapodya prolifera JEL478]